MKRQVGERKEVVTCVRGIHLLFTRSAGTWVLLWPAGW